MKNKLSIYSLQHEDLDELKEFTDQWIGTNYFSIKELEHYYKLGKIGDLNASYVAKSNQKIVGLRLSFAPGNVLSEFKNGLTTNKWNVPPETVGYFKSLFISEEFQAMGLGKKLSQASIETLKKMGAKAVLCHSWNESPNNSSRRYLDKMGFIPIETHPKFWNHIDYDCTRCAPNRCICDATEMILYI